MTCSRHEHSLFLHAHGQLSGMKRWFLESHLQSCDMCRARWARCVVEKDALRRALAPVYELDSPARSLMDDVSSRIRVERQDPGFAPLAALALGGGRLSSAPHPRRALLMAVAVAALAIALSALAAYWPADGWGAAGAVSKPDLSYQMIGSPCGSCHPGETMPASKRNASAEPSGGLTPGFRSVGESATALSPAPGAAPGPAPGLIAAPAACPVPPK